MAVTSVVEFLRRLRKAITGALVWDLFMVWVAMINLGLIAFDLTYLWLRPTYVRFLPIVTRVYDPVLGIEDHPLTAQLVKAVDEAAQLALLDPQSPRLLTMQTDLITLTHRLFTEQPFERSNQERSKNIIARILATESGHTTADLRRPEVLDEVVVDFWTAPPDLLKHRYALFQSKVRPLLEVNYYREFNRWGRLTDHFWIIDLPFLALFWVEFLTRWVLALRRRTYARWFFFPIFNWYDLLGLIPLPQFRIFRLLRAVSMYMRLRRSELSSIGKDAASRFVEYISNIITEEVSDRVAIRILEEYAEEIRDGTHLRIIADTFGSRRRVIERTLAETISQIATDPVTLDRVRAMLDLNLRRAVDESDRLSSLPLPDAVLRPVVFAVGDTILTTTLETLTGTLDSDEGREQLEDLSAALIDGILQGPVHQEILRLIEDISIHVIDEMKATVAVKKWALPDEPEEPEPELLEG
jgi:hypothetical protein